MPLVNRSILISLIAISLIFFSPESFANARDRGDKARLAIPLSAAAAGLMMNDMPGVNQLAITLLVATAATESLKWIVHERRPNGECCVSFPSGHTSIAFGGAAYVQQRYGFIYSIPLYVMASYVGYSRVFAKSHYTQDVIAGAGVGILSAWLSTTAYKNRPISFEFHGRYAGIIYRKVFD